MPPELQALNKYQLLVTPSGMNEPQSDPVIRCKSSGARTEGHFLALPHCSWMTPDRFNSQCLSFLICKWEITVIHILGLV